MKLRYIAYSALLALVAVGTSSCEDFLSKNPDNRVELETSDQMQMLLVSAYTTGNLAVMGELSGDNYVDNNAPNEKGNRYNLAEFERMDNEIFAWEPAESSDQQDSPASLWEGCYHAIACANHVLERVAEMEAEGRGDEVAAAKGEALITRAYHHFLLANLFCMPYAGPELSKSLQGIPYATTPETVLNVVYDRGNLADVYDKSLPVVRIHLVERAVFVEEFENRHVPHGRKGIALLIHGLLPYAHNGRLCIYYLRLESGKGGKQQ